MSDTYQTIKKTGEGLYKEKGSKFIAFAYHVTSEEEIKKQLDALHKEYYNARHICYAYRIGYDKDALFRINDDGEPSSTAGKPIFGQILSYDLTNILIVVIRYFGGTKLGVSGLINAYKSSAKEAILETEIITNVRTETLCLHYGYQLTNEVMRLSKEHHFDIVKQEFEHDCKLYIAVKLSEVERMRQMLLKVPGLSLL